MTGPWPVCPSADVVGNADPSALGRNRGGLRAGGAGRAVPRAPAGRWRAPALQVGTAVPVAVACNSPRGLLDTALGSARLADCFAHSFAAENDEIMTTAGCAHGPPALRDLSVSSTLPGSWADDHRCPPMDCCTLNSGPW
ncbi:hypothetical protein ACRAWF_09720 [Streptomyces sp. L7]